MLRVMGAAGADDGCEAAFGARSSEAEVWSLGEPGVDVDWKGSLGECWRFAEEVEGTGREGVSGNAGIRIVPADRCGGGQ